VKGKGKNLTQINGRITPTGANIYTSEATDATLLGKIISSTTNVIRVVIGSQNKDRHAGNNDLVQVDYVEVQTEYQN